MNIEIIATTSTSKPTKNGSYTMLEVTFKNLDSGKTDGKKIMSFASKDVFAVLSKANKGDQFKVETKKNEQTGYWDWVSASPVAAGSADASPAKAAYSAPKSTYETPEERARKQVLIIRQSSLSNAIDTLSINPGKDKIQVEDVLNLAQIYCDWVSEKEEPKIPSFDDMDDDIPL